MLTTEKLQLIFTEKVSQLKDRATNKKAKVEFTEVYCKSNEQLDRIRIHSEIDLFPEKLFVKRAPNQTDVEFEYLKANYKSVTLPVWEQFQSVLSKIWNDQNWKIDYKGNDKAKQYLESDYPKYGSLESFFKDVVTTVKEKDNNGVLALWLDIPYLPVMQDGAMVFPSISDREVLNPIVYYYECEDLIGFSDNEYAVVITELESPVAKGNKIVNEGIVFDIYDKNKIYRAFQYGKQSDFLFELIELYEHNLDVLPVKKLNGKAVQVENEVFYQSSFIPAVDALDKAVLFDSYLTASMAKVAYPREWQMVSDCTYTNDEGNKCAGGLILHNGENENCPSCAGTGMQRPGILGITQIKMPGNGLESQSPIPPGGFWSAPLDPLKFSSDQIDKNIQSAGSILNIDVSNSNVKGSDTALGKQIDREEQFAFIKRISDQIFTLFEFFNDVLIKVQQGEGAETPTITFPRNFSLRNDADLTAEIAEAQKAGLPDSTIKKLTKDYYETRFGTDVEGQKIIDLMFSTDRLMGLSNDDILKKLASRTVAGWEDILHTSIELFIEQAVLDNAKFLDLDLKAQKDTLKQMAKDAYNEINPVKVNVDNVLGNANA